MMEQYILMLIINNSESPSVTYMEVEGQSTCNFAKQTIDSKWKEKFGTWSGSMLLTVCFPKRLSSLVEK